MRSDINTHACEAQNTFQDLARVGSYVGQRNTRHILQDFAEISDSSRRPKLTLGSVGEGLARKTIALRKTQTSDDAWGRADQVAGSCFELAFRVCNTEEAEKIRFNLANCSGCVISPSDSSADFTMWIQRKVEFTHFAETKEGELELRIRPNFRASSPLIGLKLLSSLLRDFYLETDDQPVYNRKAYDLQTATGRRSWADDTFHQWYLDLSAPEISALKSIGCADYREIHQVLRDRPERAHHEERLWRDIINIDGAIAKGQVQRDIVLYRAVGGPFSRIAEENPTEDYPIPFEEPAYLFCSLHKDIALGWNRGLDRGVILEIFVPEGSNAAFLQVPGIYPERTHDEVILARNSRLLITGVTRDGARAPVFHARIEE